MTVALPDRLKPRIGGAARDAGFLHPRLSCSRHARGYSKVTRAQRTRAGRYGRARGLPKRLVRHRMTTNEAGICLTRKELRI